MTTGDGTGVMLASPGAGTYTLTANTPTTVTAAASFGPLPLTLGCGAETATGNVASVPVGQDVDKDGGSVSATRSPYHTTEGQSAFVAAAMCGSRINKAYQLGTPWTNDDIPSFFEGEAAWVIDQSIWKSIGFINYFGVPRTLASPSTLKTRHRWKAFKTRSAPEVEFVVFGAGAGSGAAFSASWTTFTDAIGLTYWRLDTVTMSSSGSGYPPSASVAIRGINGTKISYVQSPTNDYLGLPSTKTPDGSGGWSFTGVDVSDQYNAFGQLTFTKVLYRFAKLTHVEGADGSLACKDFPSGWSESNHHNGGPSQGDTVSVDDVFFGMSMNHVYTRVAGEPDVTVSIS
jgi:hypothetical protein